LEWGEKWAKVILVLANRRAQTDTNLHLFSTSRLLLVSHFFSPLPRAAHWQRSLAALVCCSREAVSRSEQRSGFKFAKNWLQICSKVAPILQRGGINDARVWRPLLSIVGPEWKNSALTDCGLAAATSSVLLGAFWRFWALLGRPQLAQRVRLEASEQEKERQSLGWTQWALVHCKPICGPPERIVSAAP